MVEKKKVIEIFFLIVKKDIQTSNIGLTAFLAFDAVIPGDLLLVENIRCNVNNTDLKTERVQLL